MLLWKHPKTVFTKRCLCNKFFCHFTLKSTFFFFFLNKQFLMFSRSCTRRFHEASFNKFHSILKEIFFFFWNLCTTFLTLSIYIIIYNEITGSTGQWKCEVYDKIINHKKSSAWHKKSHSIIIKFSCSKCKKDFNWKENLARHQKVCLVKKKKTVPVQFPWKNLDNGFFRDYSCQNWLTCQHQQL